MAQRDPRRRVRYLPATPKVDDVRTYPFPPEQTFHALGVALQALKFEINAWLPAEGRRSFSTRMSAFSWGALMWATVEPDGDGSVVQLSGESMLKTNITAERKNAVKVLDAVARQFGA